MEGSRVVIAIPTGHPFRVAALTLAVFALAAGSVWAATINGTARNDTLRRGARADKIYGKGVTTGSSARAVTTCSWVGRAMISSSAGSARTRFGAGLVATPQ
jgi:hypothetical protein